MLLMVAVPLVPWCLYSLYVITTQPSRRTLQAKKVAYWVLGIATIIAVHVYRHISTRTAANEIVARIVDYSKTHGTCPPTLEAIGSSNAVLKEKLGLSGYFCKNGNPALFYGTTYVPFETESYDFEHGLWNPPSD
ncbi:MAG: hypothetical protein V4582_18300 [Pseudomonadota bacterium]